jgi:hypothetical protein
MCSIQLFYNYRIMIWRGRGMWPVNHRLPTAASRVRNQVMSCGIYGGQSGTGAGFLLVLRFPLPILIPPTAPHSSSSVIRGWYNRPVNGRRSKWTQSHLTPRNLKKKLQKTMGNLSQERPCPNRDPNRISPGYKSEALLQESTCLALKATEI